MSDVASVEASADIGKDVLAELAPSAIPKAEEET